MNTLRHFKIVALGILALSLLWLFVIRPFNNSRFDAVVPVTGPAVQAVYATGTVEGTVMFDLKPRATGRLQALYAEEGQAVTKGQLLAQLEDDELSNSVKELEARATFAKANYERQATLFKTRSSSKDAVDRAKAEWQALEFNKKAMQARADYLKIIAPEDGILIKRDGEVGQVINTEFSVFWMTCCEPQRISAEVDEEDIVQIKSGQKVLIRADAFPNQIFNGTILSVTAKGDPIARSYRVRIGYDNSDPLMIGMTVENNIIIRETKNATLIPATAVINNKVWVVNNNQIEVRSVKLGAKNIDQAEVIDGLNLTDIIIKEPVPDLKEEQRVRYKVINK